MIRVYAAGGVLSIASMIGFITLFGNALLQKLNTRTRKTLDYKTPHTVFFAEFEQKAV